MAGRSPRAASASAVRRSAAAGWVARRYQAQVSGVGRGVVAGQQQGHDLVAELPVGHAAAVALLVAGLQEDRQQVAAAGRGPAALGDDAVDDGVQAQEAVAGPAVGRRRQPQGQRDQATAAGGEVVHQHDERLADLAGPVGDVHVEEGAGGDAERELRHLGVNVAGFAVAPGIEHAPRQGNDRLGVGGDALAAKGGLHEAALAQPELAFAQEQAVAQPGDQHALSEVLDEVAVAGGEDFLDAVGVADEGDAAGAHAQGEDVAILAGAAGVEAEDVAAPLGKGAEQPVAPRAGRRQG